MGTTGFAVIAAGEPATVSATGSRAPPVWAAIMIAALAINFVALVILGRDGGPAEGVYDEVSRSPIWAQMPITCPISV